MHKIAPTRSAIGWYACPLHLSARDPRHRPMSVAIVIPEIGFDELPMMPTIRLETVTKKNPKTTTRSPVRSDPGNVPGNVGRNAMIATSATHPPTTIDSGRSRSVRFLDAAPADPPRRSLSESAKLLTIVGSDLRSVITPAHATAPAPMYRMYAR